MPFDMLLLNSVDLKHHYCFSRFSIWLISIELILRRLMVSSPSKWKYIIPFCLYWHKLIYWHGANSEYFYFHLLSNVVFTVSNNQTITGDVVLAVFYFLAVHPHFSFQTQLEWNLNKRFLRFILFVYMPILIPGHWLFYVNIFIKL